jgi:hypothetical protein
MDKETIEKLRAVVQQARDVAGHIQQPGFPVNQFQSSVLAEMPPRGPDKALQSIEAGLTAIANEIDSYLCKRALSSRNPGKTGK